MISNVYIQFVTAMFSDVSNFFYHLSGRSMLGETNPLSSKPGSIRGDFCIDMGRNICHGSDSVESAEKEIKLWFEDSEVQTNYSHTLDVHIYE